MQEKREYMPSESELVHAERMLSPEQSVMSRARHEVLKHLRSLEKAGITVEQINQAAAEAGEEALVEYREVQNQEPWNGAMRALEAAKEEISPDDRLLLDTRLKSAKDFVLRWRDALEEQRSYRAMQGEDMSLKDILVYTGPWSAYAPIGSYDSVFDYGTGTAAVIRGFHSFPIMDPQYRSAIDNTLTKGDRRGQEMVLPSKGGIAKIFDALGIAKIPEPRKSMYAIKALGDFIPSRFPGVYVTLRGDQTVDIVFDSDTLLKMIQAHAYEK